jgi:NADPH:quinone reductase-like Zn-dependent oxidoreductase
VRAVQFDGYGDASVLRVDDVDEPTAGAGQVLVRVKATGLNPAEAKIRSGMARTYADLTFPARQGSELAGVIVALGAGVSQWSVGDEVLGWSRDRLAQAELAPVAADDLMIKPGDIPFEVAGALVGAGCTAWAAVEAIPAVAEEIAVVAGAGGAIGALVVQLMRQRGATVFGIAGVHHHDRLRALGATPLAPGDDVGAWARAAEPGQITTFIDTVGSPYVEQALALGLPPDRVHTVIDFPAIETYGVSGGAVSASIDVVAKLVEMLSADTITVRVAATFPLERVQDAYSYLADGHPGGKVVLIP